ncbi:MAG: hypothetical protein ACXWPM_10470 [Bdellovibrionota bacterium]
MKTQIVSVGALLATLTGTLILVSTFPSSALAMGGAPVVIGGSGPAYTPPTAAPIAITPIAITPLPATTPKPISVPINVPLGAYVLVEAEGSDCVTYYQSMNNLINQLKTNAQQIQNSQLSMQSEILSLSVSQFAASDFAAGHDIHGTTGGGLGPTYPSSDAIQYSNLMNQVHQAQVKFDYDYNVILGLRQNWAKAKVDCEQAYINYVDQRQVFDQDFAKLSSADSQTAAANSDVIQCRLKPVLNLALSATACIDPPPVLPIEAGIGR